jgi:hypothetical protein
MLSEYGMKYSSQECPIVKWEEINKYHEMFYETVPHTV